MIGRREFITLVGGAAAAWPLAAYGSLRARFWARLTPGVKRKC